VFKSVMVLFLGLLSFGVLANGFSNCLQKTVYAKGWFRKYQYAHMNITQVSNKGNSSEVSTQKSTEHSTASSDPGVSSGFSTSDSQSTSSWGECSPFKVMAYLNKQRELYIAQNLFEIKKQMAVGKGGHIEALSFFSYCGPEAVPVLSQQMQQQFDRFAFINRLNQNQFSKELEQIIHSSKFLQKNCHRDLVKKS